MHILRLKSVLNGNRPRPTALKDNMHRLGRVGRCHKRWKDEKGKEVKRCWLCFMSLFSLSSHYLFTFSLFHFCFPALPTDQPLRGSSHNKCFLFPHHVLYGMLMRCMQSELSEINWVEKWLLSQQSLRGSWRDSHFFTNMVLLKKKQFLTPN